MNVSLRQLRVFLAVAAQGSFTAAARELGMSQSAASLNLRLLEEALGLRLFDRTTRQARLTEIGAALAASASRLLEGLDATLREARDTGAQKRGTVRFAAVPTAAQRLLPAAIAACAQRHPAITLRPADCAATEVVRRVAIGEAEFGLCSAPMPLEGLLAESLGEDPFVLLCPRGHPLAARRRVPWAALGGEALVMLDNSSGSRNVIESALAASGAVARVVLELTQPASVAAMVAAGLGLAALPELALPFPAHPGLVARPLTPSASRSMVLVRRADRSLSPAAAAFQAVIRETAAKVLRPRS